MNNLEICKNFRDSKNKKFQIGILADLNECSKNDIIKILMEAGEDMSCMQQKKPIEVIIPVQAGFPNFVFEVLYEKMEMLDKQIREKEKEYKQLAEFIQSFGGQQDDRCK